MRKLKVCQFITELRPAGAERCVYELSTRLDKSQFEVQVISLRGGAMADRLTKAGIPVTVLNMRNKFDATVLLKLVRLLRNYNPDILHTHLFHADLAGRIGAYFTKVPHLVNTVHVAEGRFRPWHFSFARICSKKCERIICISPSVKEFHQAKTRLPDKNYEVILNGIDVPAFSHDPQARSEYRKQWEIENETPLVGFVGRLDPQKGIDTLLSAMSHLAARGEALDLVIAGDGPQRDIVENFIKHGEGGKRARWIGFCDDVRGILSSIDILAMPSRWEGFGLVAGEAMAAGLPVVSTNVTGLCDVVEDQKTGLVVEKNDPFKLAESIMQLAQDSELRQQLGQAGKQRVEEEFSIDSTIEKHQQLYMQIAQDRLKPQIKASFFNWKKA